MKALILQMRGIEDSSRLIEQQEYIDYTGLDKKQIDFVDLYDEPDLNPEKVLEYDVLFSGGISKDSPTELSWPESRFPFIHNFRTLMRLAIEKKIPTFLSCGGYVIAGHMLGAKMLNRVRDFELGVYRLQKTEAAKTDIFLGPVSDRLPMVAGHVKYFAETPPGTELMFYTNEYGPKIPIHAFKVKNAPFYAFQGHPEISCQELSDRIKPMLYRKHYFPKRPGNVVDEKKGYNEEAYLAFCDLEADTSEAQDLLKRFVSLTQSGIF